ncbi:hypothetical protein JC775_20360 (plasmid) [Bacillus cytotoxicus]|nr:hypothetical protein JC775_20360 [Bacillus cytotoxicus]
MDTGKIVDTKIVNEDSEKSFHMSLNIAITEMQEKGLYVELKYQPIVRVSGTIKHMALVIGRILNKLWLVGVFCV